MRKTHIPFYILAASIFALMAITTWSDGMFCDGIMYAAISQNLANDIGSFWFLKFSDTLLADFHEHPPLHFFLQGLCFKLFGNSIFIERIFSFLSIVFSFGIVILIWNELTKKKHHKYAWLPMLLLTTIPLITWAAANNILENLMMIFTSLSVLFILKSRNKYRGLFLALAGLCIMCAFLTKGFPSLYIWSFPFWLWLFLRKSNFKQMIADSLMILLFSIIPIILLILFNNAAAESLRIYVERQVIGSISNIQTVNYRFYILQRVLEETALISLIVLAKIFFERKLKPKYQNSKLYTKEAIAMILLAFSGIIPVMVSMKQSGFYVLSSFPLIAIGASLYILPTIELLITKINIEKRSFKLFRGSVIILLSIAIIASIIYSSKIGRDNHRLPDIYKICDVLEQDEIISVSKPYESDWSMYAYFMRINNIHLDPSNDNHDYYLDIKESDSTRFKNYEKLELNLNAYTLYRKKKSDLYIP